MARWIVRDKPPEVYVRQLQREIRLPGLMTAEAIYEAADVLVDADWLAKPPAGVGHRGRSAYPLNPRVWEAMP